MLDLESQYLLFRHATPDVRCEDGDVVFDEGETGECMYLVRSGRVEIRLQDTVLYTVEAGGLFGEMALVDGSPRSARAVAVGPVRLVPIGLQRFKFLIQASPDFSLGVMRVMAGRLRTANDRILDGEGGAA